MNYPKPDPDAPLGSPQHPIHASTLARIVDATDYTPPGGGVWAKTVAGTAFHQRQADVCNGAPHKTAAQYLDAALAEERGPIAWGRHTHDTLAREIEAWSRAIDLVHRPSARTACKAEVAFRFHDESTGLWYEGELDEVQFVGTNKQITGVGVTDYKTGEKAPDTRLHPQHHLYCLGVLYGVLSIGVPYHAEVHLLDWSGETGDPWRLNLWPQAFRYFHITSLLARGSWNMLALATDGSLMSEPNSREYIRKLTKQLLDAQPQRVAVAVTAKPTIETETMGNPQTAANPFKKATKAAAKLRLALIGPSGSGKTYTALKIATSLGKRVAVIDTERGSAAKYADEFSFDVVELERFEPLAYCDLIVAGAEQYDVIVIDSLSHAWAGPGGVLEFVDAKNGNGGSNKFAAWRDATPMHNELVNTILAAKCHIIATMRSKMEYVQEKDERGKVTIRKVGMQPVQREGMEYEFDVIGDLDAATMTVSKTRCKALHDRRFVQPGADVAKLLSEWLGASTAAPAPAPAPEQPAAPQYSWGEPRGEGFATDAQIKRLKANCAAMGVGETKCLARIIQLAGEFGTAGIASVAEIPFPVATKIVIKVEEALKAKGIPRPEREKTEAERVEEQVRQIVGELRTKRAKELAELVRNSPLSANEIIDIMANEAAPNMQFSALAEPQQEQVLHTIKQAAQAAADRVALAANGNGHH